MGRIAITGICVAALGVGLFLAPSLASAQGSAIQGRSLASALLQNRTQTRILKADDKVDIACKDKHFAAAQVVKAPEVIAVSTRVSERKWQEQWTLVRCGQTVGYRVFFTEVGKGGAYFSFVQTD